MLGTFIILPWKGVDSKCSGLHFGKVWIQNDLVLDFGETCYNKTSEIQWTSLGSWRDSRNEKTRKNCNCTSLSHSQVQIDLLAKHYCVACSGQDWRYSVDVSDWKHPLLNTQTMKKVHIRKDKIHRYFEIEIVDWSLVATFEFSESQMRWVRSKLIAILRLEENPRFTTVPKELGGRNYRPGASPWVWFNKLNCTQRILRYPNSPRYVRGHVASTAQLSGSAASAVMSFFPSKRERGIQ